MSKRIKPKFNKKMPKNARFYINPSSDDAFKAEHPIIYKVLVACAITVLMLPIIIYMVFVVGIYPAPDSGWIALGWVGSFIIGIGFFNIVAAWIGQYLGHLVTGLCIGAGALLVGVSIFLLYNQTLYNFFDQEMVDYYFINMFFLCIPAIYYVVFRSGVDTWLRAKRISKLIIKKSKIGKKNFWWYEEINEKYYMGLLYHINRLFTIAYTVAFILHFLFGWIKIVSIPVSILLVFSSVLASLMSLFSSIQSNKKVHGQPFVLIARSQNDGIDSFVLDFFIAALPLGIAYAELIAISNLW